MKKKCEMREFLWRNDLKKFLLMMKFTVVFLLVFTVQLSASVYSQQTRLKVDFNQATMKEVMAEIERQTGLTFFYSPDVLDTNQTVTLNTRSMLLEDILMLVARQTGLSLEIVKDEIIVKKEVSAEQEVAVQQPRAVTGKVTDFLGTGLPGVTVVLKGSSSGTITGSDGSFSLSNLPPDAVLVFSFVGMTTQEISIAGKTTVSVVMEEEAIGIEEVVAVGYGTQKKLTVTGSVVSTKGEDIIKSHTANVINSVIGQLPGVIINTRSGEPGRDDPTVYIRGRSTTGTSTPLIVIDGVPRDYLGRLNPNDIESITVLKDASAAIYGARAANGVILVTTKKGKEGTPVFNFSYNQGFSQPTRNVKMADSYTFAKVYNEIEVRSGRPAKYNDEELQKYKDGTDPNYANTDWYDFITKEFTPQHRTNLSVSGGNQSLNYYISVGEQAQDGQFNYGSLKTKQYNLRSNLEVKIADILKVGLSVAGRYDKNHYPYQNARSLYSHIFLYQPNWTPYWPGTNYLTPNRDSENILNWVSDKAGTNDARYKGFETTLNFDLKIPWVDGLSVAGSANWDGGYNYNKVFRLPTYVYYKNGSTGELYEARSGSGVNKATLADTFDQNSTLTVNAKINYNRRFGNHNLGVILGYEEMQYRYDYLYAFRSDFSATALEILDAGSSDKTKQANNGTSSETSRQNYFGRATYDYENKYLAQFIFRYDGSPNFAETKRWGFFPGVSLGWRISEEPFMAHAKSVIDNLKIRASYGEMGNDAVTAFQYLTTYAYGNNYVIGNSDVLGLVQSGIPNPDITWEVAKTTNLGFESTLWGGLLGIEFDLFKTERSNILTKRNAIVPDYTGLTLPDENIGIVENKGFELQLSHRNNWNKLQYSLNGSFSFARNKVVYADEAPAAEKYQFATGRPIGSSLYYHAIGIFSTQEDVDAYPHMSGAVPGDIIYEDVNKDGSINSRDMIRENETAIPEIVYGLNASFQFKNFDLSVLFQGQANAKVYFETYFQAMSYSLGNFSQWRANDHWSPDNINATMPRASLELWNNNAKNVASTHWLMNSDFLRLKNLELGYTLPSSVSKKIGTQNLRVYASGNNLLILFDRMKEGGFDPETSAYWWYPQQRVFNIGVNLTF